MINNSTPSVNFWLSFSGSAGIAELIHLESDNESDSYGGAGNRKQDAVPCATSEVESYSKFDSRCSESQFSLGNKGLWSVCSVKQTDYIFWTSYIGHIFDLFVQWRHLFQFSTLCLKLLDHFSGNVSVTPMYGERSVDLTYPEYEIPQVPLSL